jgi:hypothetical protein
MSKAYGQDWSPRRHRRYALHKPGVCAGHRQIHDRPCVILAVEIR